MSWSDDADFETANDNVVWWESQASHLAGCWREATSKATQTKFLAVGAKQELEISRDSGASEQDKNMVSQSASSLLGQP